MIWFEWDERKAESNRLKHGITFDDAIEVFEDPFALSAPDRIEGGELRWTTIGMVEGFVIVFVAHTVRDEESADEVIRIISARRATRKERIRYEQNREKECC